MSGLKFNGCSRHAMCVILLVMGIGVFTPGALAQSNQPPGFRGIVCKVSEDQRSFTIVDRSGATMTIQVGPNTTYDAARAATNFAAAARFGMEVRGTFAPDGSAAQISARGIVDEIEVVQMQAFLGVTDEEWAVLRPKIEKIEALERLAEGRDPSNNNRAGNIVSQNPVRAGEDALRTAFFEPLRGGAPIGHYLAALREARAKARNDLATARHDLTQLLTTRQETLLVLVGILE